MSDFFASFHFIRPLWLLGFLPVLWLIFQQSSQSTASAWSKVIDKNLLPFLIKQDSKKSTNLFLHRLCFSVFLLLVVLSLSGPTYKKMAQYSNLMSQPIIVLLELSENMLSADLSPNRLQRAKFKLLDLLKNLEGQISLIAFAGDAHVVAPPTKDYKTITELLKDLAPNVMPIKGVNFTKAIEKAKEISDSVGSSKVLSVTSSNFEESSEKIIALIKKSKLEILFWTFASANGAPVIDSEGRFGKASNEAVLISKLDEEKLKAIAKATTASYLSFTHDEKDIERIISFAKQSDVHQTADGVQYDEWLDLGPYVLFIALIPFLVLFFSNNILFCLLLLCFLPKKVDAFNFKNFFLRKDQIAYDLLQNNQPKEAIDLFSDPESKGVSYYKANDFENAALELEKSTTSDGKYNLGNAYAKLGKIDQAIKAYDEALHMDPKNEDAKFNKELLEKLKEQQKQNEENQQNQDKQENQDKKEQEQKKNDSEQQKQQQQEKDEQKQQENAAKNEKKDSSQSEENKEKSASQKEEQNQKQQEKNKEHAEEKKQEQSKSSADDKQPKNDEKKEAYSTKENEVKTKEQQKMDYYLEKINQDKTSYFKRKFRYESSMENRK